MFWQKRTAWRVASLLAGWCVARISRASPAWMQGLGHLDQLLAIWEWRMAPTPWLVLEPNDAGA